MNKKVRALEPNRQTIESAAIIQVATYDLSAGGYAVRVGQERLPVLGYVSAIPGVVPALRDGDRVLVSRSTEGAWIHGLVQPLDAASTVRIGVEDGRLLIDAPGALTLMSGKSRIAIDADGRIRIEGRQYATVVEGNLRLQGSIIELN